MVKRATFLQMFLVAALFIIICAYGLAAAKDSLVLKYLPVDHDVETVRQENDSAHPLSLNQTGNPFTEQIIRGHIGCLTCRELVKPGGSHCPDCCLSNNNTSIRCQDATDPGCRDPGLSPFNTATCSNVSSCADTFKRDCDCSSGQCSKYPEPYTNCLQKGCPGTTKPAGGTCKEYPLGSKVWYCKKNDLKPQAPCAPRNATLFQSCNYTSAAAYGTATAAPALPSNCTAAGLSSPCYIYNATSAYNICIDGCIAYVNGWEQAYYEYNNATLGKKICPAGDCNSGFKQNCDVEKCGERLATDCGNFTAEACVNIEESYKEMLLGNIAGLFQEISPGFGYKFVARNGEQYMIAWQVGCEVIEHDPRYNLYTMIKVWNQEQQNPAIHQPVYQSIVHQKALGSTFYINAQTGMDAKKAPGLKPGKAYIVKLYYFLPNDGETDLTVDVKVIELILYRTKN